MPIPAGVQQFVFGGALPDGERWQSGFWLSGGLPTTQAGANEQANILLGSMLASDSSGVMRNFLESFLPNNITIDLGRVYVYTAGGPTADLIGEADPVSVAGGHSGTVMPNQCAIVVSLRTGAPGRRHRGRMYLPAGASTLTHTGQLASEVYTALATGWGVYFGDVAASEAGTPIVLSRVSGTFRQISQVIVDSRVDIQRRRANRETIEGSATHGAIGP